MTRQGLPMINKKNGNKKNFFVTNENSRIKLKQTDRWKIKTFFENERDSDLICV